MADFFSLISTLEFALKRIQPMDGGVPMEQGARFGTRTNFTNGAGAVKVDEQWFDSISLAAGATTLDLQALTQKDADGGTVRSGISFDGIKGFMIRNTTPVATGGHLLVGGAAANPWDGGGALIDTASAKIRVPAGGEIFVLNRSAAGMPVTATELNLELEAVTQTQTFDIALAGLAS